MPESPFAFKRCPDCDAQNRPDMPRCWLCGRPFAPGASRTADGNASRDVVPVEMVDESVFPDARPAPPRTTGAGLGFGVATFVLVICFAVLLYGVFQEAAGLAIMLLIVGAPGLAAVVMTGQQGKSTGQKPGIAQQLGTFVLVTVLATTLGGFAAFATFFVVCIVALATMQGNNADDSIFIAMFAIGGLAGLAAVGFAIWLGVKLTAPRH